MRCLYCDKKLSLLKLAKGDSYCSPAHFDAHQLQISKSAFERLTSIPAHDRPKTPLVIKAKEDPVPPMAAVDDTAEAARQTLVMARLAAVQAPPFATFSKPRLQLKPPGSPSPKAIEPEVAVAQAEVAFPAHDVEVTAGLIALHLRLKDSELAPLACAAAPSSPAAEEDFPPRLMYPSLAIESEIQEVEEAPLDASEPAPLMETTPPQAALPLDTAPARNEQDSLAPLASAAGTPILPVNRVKPVRPPIDPRIPFLTAPSFRERSVAVILLDRAASAIPNPAAAPPILASGTPASPQSVGSVAPSTAFSGIANPLAQSEPGSLLRSAPPLHTAAVQLLPVVRGREILPGLHSCSVPAELTLPPIDIAQPAFQAGEFAATSLSLACPDASPPAGFEQPAPATRPLVTRSLAPKSGAPAAPRDLPQPEAPDRNTLAGPAASALEKPAMTPGALLARASRILTAKQTMTFVDPTPSAMEFGFRATSSSLRIPEVPDLTWRTQSSTFALPALLADQSAAAVLPLAPLDPPPACRKTEPACLGDASLAQTPSRRVMWMQRDSGLVPGPRPKPSIRQPSARCLPLLEIGNQNSMAQRPAVVRTLDHPFASAPATPFELEDERPADLGFTLPNAGASLIGLGQMVSGTVSAHWEPRPSSVTDTPVLKFLPVRQGPRLPPARSWPQLGPPAR